MDALTTALLFLLIPVLLFLLLAYWLDKNKEHWHFLSGYEENKRSRPRNSFLAALITQPDNSRVWGFDISGRWDGLVDFVVAKSRGASFVIIKCTEGTVNTPLFIENITAALKEGLVSGAYHWLHRNAVVSCKAQANAAWNRIKAFPKILPLVIDLEATKWNGLPSNPNYTDVELFADEFILLSKRKPILYSSPGYLGMLGPIPPSLMKKLAGVHIAHYGVVSPSYANWLFWQFSAEGDAQFLAPGNTGKLELDLDYYAGSLAGLYELAGLISPDPDPIPPNEETMKKGTVKTGYTLTVRDAAGVDTGVRLRGGDVVYGEVVNGRIYFERIYRGGVTVEEQAGNASTGTATEAYMTLIDAVDPQPAPADEIRVKEVKLTIVINGQEYTKTLIVDEVLEPVNA